MYASDTCQMIEMSEQISIFSGSATIPCELCSESPASDIAFRGPMSAFIVSGISLGCCPISRSVPWLLLSYERIVLGFFPGTTGLLCSFHFLPYLVSEFLAFCIKVQESVDWPLHMGAIEIIGRLRGMMT